MSVNHPTGANQLVLGKVENCLMNHDNYKNFTNINWLHKAQKDHFPHYTLTCLIILNNYFQIYPKKYSKKICLSNHNNPSKSLIYKRMNSQNWIMNLVQLWSINSAVWATRYNRWPSIKEIRLQRRSLLYSKEQIN